MLLKWKPSTTRPYLHGCSYLYLTDKYVILSGSLYRANFFFLICYPPFSDKNEGRPRPGHKLWVSEMLFQYQKACFPKAVSNIPSHRSNEGIGQAGPCEMIKRSWMDVVWWYLLPGHFPCFFFFFICSITLIQRESRNSMVPQMFLPEIWLGKGCSTPSTQLAKRSFFNIHVYTPFMNQGSSFLSWAPAVWPHHGVL